MSDAPTSPTTNAIFLSYAREDSGAARRIADALRAFGVEVWFDQNELRGGDQWDGKIRKQIRECTLFVPLVSERTQARSEGYFRREWKLAVERTHDMADGIAFIVPVVIDDTSQHDAAVPEEFLSYQWTHLAHGVPTPQFVEQVKRLLDSPRKAAPAAKEAGRSRPPIHTGEVASPAKPHMPGWVWGAVVAVVAVGVFVFLESRKTEPTSAPAPTETKPAVATLDTRRIAVLPLDNFSPDANDEYLASGMTVELTSCLAKISGLQVVTSLSSDRLKKSGKSTSEIGNELKVGTLLAGSLRKAGEQLRISVQLIDVATQRQVWSHDYNTKFDDVFKMQSDVAERVAEELKVELLGSEVQRLKKDPTANIAAYQLYLKGRFHQFQSTPEDAAKAREYFKQALSIDPNYALAYCGFTDTGTPKSVPREIWPEIEKAAHKALELDDNLAEAHLAMAGVKCWFEWNWAAAETGFKRAIALKPSLPTARNNYGNFLMAMGRFEEAIVEMKKAVDLDPTSPAMMADLGNAYYTARKYDLAIAHGRKAIALDENFVTAHGSVGWAYAMQGKLAEARLELQLAVTLEKNPWTIWSVGCCDALAGRSVEARRAIGELTELSESRFVSALYPAGIHQFLGEKERMFELLEKTYGERDPACVWLRVDPIWDRVRSDPRFQALLKKIGLEP